MRNYITIPISLLFISGCVISPQQVNINESFRMENQPYRGFAQDQANLRDTYLIEKQNIRTSSEKANEAAHRIFTKIRFVGMPKEEVLRLLGDPATISDYGEKVGTADDFNKKSAEQIASERALHQLGIVDRVAVVA